jgi:beta-lactam-binding protein with PASTA domain
VPEVRPKSIVDAAAAVAATGLSLCDPVPASGFVLRQSPGAGTQIEADQCVTVVAEPGVPVPDVVGLATDDARDRLSQAFLTLRTARRQGRIATQNPTPGTVVEPGSAVLVTFAAVVVTPPSPPSSPPPRGRTPPPPSSSALTFPAASPRLWPTMQPGLR